MRRKRSKKVREVDIKREEREARIANAIVISTIIIVLAITLIALLPGAAVDAIMYFGWKWLFGPVQASRLTLILAAVVLFFVSPYIFPWVIYNDGRRAVYRIRRAVKIEGSEVRIYFNDGSYIKCHKGRVFRKWNAMVIFGDYTLYHRDKEIEIQGPQLELLEEERLKKKLQMAEERADYAEYRLRLLMRMYGLEKLGDLEEEKKEEEKKR